MAYISSKLLTLDTDDIFIILSELKNKGYRMQFDSVLANDSNEVAEVTVEMKDGKQVAIINFYTKDE